MKISVCQVRGNSGADVWCTNHCQGLRAAGIDCTVEFFSPVYQFIPALGNVLGKIPDADIIHGNSWNALAFRQKCPLVVTELHVVHDPLFDPYRSAAQRAYHSWIFRCERKSFEIADAITCISRYTQKKLEECFGIRDSRMIYPGIDTDLFRPAIQKNDPCDIPPEKTVLFFAGNLSRRKGGDLLPAIMKDLGEDFILLLATGQRGSDTGGIKSIINLGRLDLPRLVMAYNRCDIFLSASRLEGFGLSVAEAMACGKPVIATNSASLPELVIDGKGGFLCRMDDVQDFTERIRYLATDENMRREMGRFNRALTEEKFTLGRMTGEYLDVYQDLLR